MATHASKVNNMNNILFSTDHCCSPTQDRSDMHSQMCCTHGVTICCANTKQCLSSNTASQSHLSIWIHYLPSKMHLKLYATQESDLERAQTDLNNNLCCLFHCMFQHIALRCAHCNPCRYTSSQHAHVALQRSIILPKPATQERRGKLVTAPDHRCKSSEYALTFQGLLQVRIECDCLP